MKQPTFLFFVGVDVFVVVRCTYGWLDGYLCLRRGYVFLGCLEAVSFSEYLFILFGFYSFSSSTSFSISRVRSWSTPHWLNVVVYIIVVFGPKDPYKLI